MTILSNFWGVRSCTILVMLCVFQHTTVEKLGAATIEISQSVYCDFVLQGTLESGDTAKLISEGWFAESHQTRHQSQMYAMRLCLNSPGGSLLEGLMLFEAIWNGGIMTVVPPNAVCASACALAFLGGSSEDGVHGLRHQRRYLHISGRLGFHSPFILVEDSRYDADQLVESFNLGLVVSNRIVRMLDIVDDGVRPFNSELLNLIFSTPANEMYFIENFSDAAVIGVDILGLEATPIVGHREIENICDAAYLRLFQFSHFSSAIANLSGGVHNFPTSTRWTSILSSAYWRGPMTPRRVFAFSDGVDMNSLDSHRQILGAVIGYPLNRHERLACRVEANSFFAMSSYSQNWGTWLGGAHDAQDFRDRVDHQYTVSVSFYSHSRLFTEDSDFHALMQGSDEDQDAFIFEEHVMMPIIFFNNMHSQFP